MGNGANEITYPAEHLGVEENGTHQPDREKLLRRIVLRLALASEGQTPSLDRYLNDLRSALHEEKITADLDELIEPLSAALLELDDQKQQPRSVPDVLSRILDVIPVPPCLSSRYQHLRAQLNGEVKSCDIQRLTDETLEIIVDSLVEGHTKPKSNSRRSMPGQVGFFGKLFASGASPRVIESDPGAHTGESREAGRNGSEALFLSFLKRIEPLVEQDEDVEQLRARLRTGIADGRWPDFLQHMTDILSRTCWCNEEKKDELERFLRQLNARLLEMGRSLGQVWQAQGDAYQEGLRLNEAVDTEVQRINVSLDETDDFKALRQSVQQGLDAISDRMRAFRQTEEQRYQQDQVQIQMLQERVQSAEQEAEDLRRNFSRERDKALLDGLTGIPNRQGYEERLQQEFARWQRFLAPLSLAILDADYFKSINDNFGHSAGDKALKALAGILNDHLRETDFLARYGGEEFVVLLPNTALEDGLLAVERFRGSVAECAFRYQGVSVPITISGGVAQFQEGDLPQDVFERADRALYLAKEAGRNCSRAQPE